MYTYSYTITKEDCVNIFKETNATLPLRGYPQTPYQMARDSLVCMLICASVGMFVLYLCLTTAGLTEKDSDGLIGVGLICIFMFVLSLLYTLAIFITCKKQIGKMLDININETGISINNIYYDWDKIVDVYITDNVLFLRKNVYYIKVSEFTLKNEKLMQNAQEVAKRRKIEIAIPKRIFNSEDELNEVYEFIKSKVNR